MKNEKQKQKNYFIIPPIGFDQSNLLLFGLLVPSLILLVALSCKHDLYSENDMCLKGRIIGNGCNIEGYLIELVDHHKDDIEVGSVIIGDQKFDNVIMSFNLPTSEHWEIGDELFFNFDYEPIEKDSYLCQDLYAIAPAYNLIGISKSKCP